MSPTPVFQYFFILLERRKLLKLLFKEGVSTFPVLYLPKSAFKNAIDAVVFDLKVINFAFVTVQIVFKIFIF